MDFSAYFNVGETWTSSSLDPNSLNPYTAANGRGTMDALITPGTAQPRVSHRTAPAPPQLSVIHWLWQSQ